MPRVQGGAPRSETEPRATVHVARVIGSGEQAKEDPCV